jgi:transposase
MRLNRSTVFGWLYKYHRKGVKALKSTKAPGARSKLKQKQILKLVEMFHKPAVEYGFVSDLWTGPRVRVVIKQEFGVNLHRKHMPRFLRRLGLVRKSAERRALEQDPKAVRRWKRHVLPSIVRSVDRCRGLLLYGDEALFVLIPYVGKTWTFPDVKPVARVSGKRGVRVGATSAVSPNGHLLFQFSKGNFNAKTLIRFINALHKHFGKRKLFFIIDGAPSHRARVVEQYAKDNKLWLSLHRLPGYSPELNPDEEVWNHVKTNQLNARPMSGKKQLQTVVMGSLRSLQKRPKQVKEFFDK